MREKAGAVQKQAEEVQEKAALQLGEVVLDEPSLVNSPILPYVRMIVSLIEGVRFSCHQLVSLLQETLRQHSIAYRTRTDYVLAFLHQHPP